MRQLHSTDALYRKHQRQIFQLANSHARNAPLNSSDLVSLSSEVFMRCADKWNPERGNFSTLLHIALTNAFKQETARARRRGEETLNGQAEWMADARPDNAMDFLIDFTAGLTDDAMRMVALLLDGDLDTRGLRETRHVVRTAIRRAVPWTRSRKDAAMDELENALKQA